MDMRAKERRRLERTANKLARKLARIRADLDRGDWSMYQSNERRAWRGRRVAV